MLVPDIGNLRGDHAARGVRDLGLRRRPAAGLLDPVHLRARDADHGPVRRRRASTALSYHQTRMRRPATSTTVTIMIDSPRPPDAVLDALGGASAAERAKGSRRPPVVIAAFLAGLVAGYGIAIPVGAVAAYLITLGAAHGFPTAAAGGLGAASVDALYAGVAVTLGALLAPLIITVATPLRWLSGLVLVGVAVRMIVLGLRPRSAPTSRRTHRHRVGPTRPCSRSPSSTRPPSSTSPPWSEAPRRASPPPRRRWPSCSPPGSPRPAGSCCSRGPVQDSGGC